VAFQSEIELKVKVLDSQLDKLENRIQKLGKTNPFSASGASKTNKKALQQERALLNVDKNRAQLQLQLKQGQIKELNIRNTWVKALAQGLEIRKDIAKAAEKEAKATKKTADAAKKTAAATKKAAAGKAKNRSQDVLLGAGFPLLFGGGLGQAAAGAIGGGLGGFGGAIAAQAVVSQVAALNTALVETASVTASTGNAYDFLTEKQLFSSEASKKLADELAELGRVEELAALTTEELVRLIGNQGVESLDKLDKEWKELLSNLAELGLAVGAFMAKYLAPLINLLNKAVGAQNQRNRFGSLVNENPEAKAFYESIVGTRNRAGVQKGLTQAEARAQTLEKFEPIVTVEIPVTPEDRNRFAPPKPGKAPKERESRIPELERELALQTKILGIQEKISAAELAKDSDTVARLGGEIKLAKLATDRAAIIADIEIPAEERRLQLAINSVEIKAAEVETSDRLNQIEQARIENIENSITGFENEVALMQEETEFAKDLLKIEQQIAELRKNDPNISEGLVERLRTAAKAAAEAREEQRKYNEVLSMAQGPVNAFVNGITQGLQGIVDGTMSAQEAFAKMLRGVADALVQTATTMIAQYIAIGIARKFAGISGGDGLSTAGSSTGAFDSGVGGIFPTNPAFSYEGGGYTGNAPRSGGIDGRGGFPAILHPNETVIDHSSVMGKYSGAGSSSNGGNKTIRFESTVINNVEYVTTDQAMAMSRAAANDGAKRGAEGGYGRSMRALQNSRSQRSKLGMRR
jgi:septal ring factor EnvC (AmiA/AmiB activator)